MWFVVLCIPFHTDQKDAVHLVVCKCYEAGAYCASYDRLQAGSVSVT